MAEAWPCLFSTWSWESTVLLMMRKDCKTLKGLHISYRSNCQKSVDFCTFLWDSRQDFFFKYGICILRVENQILLPSATSTEFMSPRNNNIVIKANHPSFAFRHVKHMVPVRIFFLIYKSALCRSCGQYHTIQLHFRRIFVVPVFDWINLEAEINLCCCFGLFFNHPTSSEMNIWPAGRQRSVIASYTTMTHSLA